MGKGDVTMKFDAETAAFVQAVNKAREAMEAGAESGRKLGDSLGSAGERGSKSIGLVVDAVSAAKEGIKLSLEAANNYFEMMERRADKMIEKTRTLNTALAGAGQAAVSPAVRSQLSAIAATDFEGMRFSGKQVTDTFAGISAQLGSRVSAADKIAATRAAMQAQAADISPEQSIGIGTTFGKLARERRAGGAFEGYTDEQLGTMALQLSRVDSAPLSDREMRIFAQSSDKKEAFQMLLAARNSELGARGLATIQDEAESAYTRRDMQGMSPAERRRIKRLQAIPAEERYAAILKDPSLVPEKQRRGVEALAQGLASLPPAETLDQAVATSRQTEDVASAVARVQQNNKAEEGITNAQGADEAAMLKAYRERAMDLTRRANPILSQIPGFEFVAGLSQRLSPELQKYGLGTASEKQAWEEVRDEIQNQNALLRTRRGTALQNDSEGQK